MHLTRLGLECLSSSRWDVGLLWGLRALRLESLLSVLPKLSVLLLRIILLLSVHCIGVVFALLRLSVGLLVPGYKRLLTWSKLERTWVEWWLTSRHGDRRCMGRYASYLYRYCCDVQWRGV